MVLLLGGVGGLRWGLERVVSVMDSDGFPRLLSPAGDGEEGGEDGAGAEHLRSGDGAGGARVLLLFRRNRARRHQIVSAS